MSSVHRVCVGDRPDELLKVGFGDRRRRCPRATGRSAGRNTRISITGGWMHSEEQTIDGSRHCGSADKTGCARKGKVRFEGLNGPSLEIRGCVNAGKGPERGTNCRRRICHSLMDRQEEDLPRQHGCEPSQETAQGGFAPRQLRPKAGSPQGSFAQEKVRPKAGSPQRRSAQKQVRPNAGSPQRRSAQKQVRPNAGSPQRWFAPTRDRPKAGSPQGRSPQVGFAPRQVRPKAGSPQG
eukprot:2746099-Pleurochrysis_carterae.AAC.1